MGIKSIDLTKPNGSLITASSIQKNQYFSCTDIISEGPILGFPDKAASIYLDNAPAADTSQGGQTLHHTSGTFNLTSGSKTVTTTNLTLNNFTSSDTTGKKYLTIHDFYTTSGVSAQRTSESSAMEITLSKSGWFTSVMKRLESDHPTLIPWVTLKIGNAIYWRGYIKDVAGNGNTATGTAITEQTFFTDKTSGEYTIGLHVSMSINTILNNTVTLFENSLITASRKGDIQDALYQSNVSENITPISDTSKYKGFSYQFKNGELIQDPVTDIYGGAGSTSISTSPNTALEYPDSSPSAVNGRFWPNVHTATPVERTSAQLGLTSSNARQVDTIQLVINYPGGLIVKSEENIYHGIQAYRLQIAIDRGDGFGSWTNLSSDGEYIYHAAATSSNFYIQETHTLDRFKPFKDFKIRITKATRDDEVNPAGAGQYDEGNSVSLSSVLSTITCIIKERFSYPWTAYASVVVDAKSFNSVPSRSYHCKGRLIRVPSNYITRDEAADGKASYKRNVSSAAIESTEQDWDGNFRDTYVYTNNPAWVFLDIISHTRYGLGTWLRAEDIDKYALYRIARYCDELVPDGNGGEEPRFTANVYLAKATDSYKVLKDMATIFRAIIYWSEGNIYAVTDSEKDPIYNFTKGNVIDGLFSYEGTGYKLRSNQISVTWNNPENDYTPEVLLVEDKDNIAKTRKIITEDAVAFGCTSKGQATRYGRWKLWTAINQKEIVSFKTSISASFLAPGDIINIQDADRYDIAYSGRVSNTAGTDTDTVKLDRTVTLNSGSVYELSVLIEESAAYLAQDTATISVGGTNTNYIRGEILATSLYANEEAASNIQDTSGNLVHINWAPYTHVESRTVSTGASNTSSLDVSTAFSAAPNVETIWALRETVGGVEVASSKRLYKILNITEEKKNEYGIQAVEHFNEKYKAIDIDFGQPYVDSLLTPSTTVPAPTSLRVTKI